MKKIITIAAVSILAGCMTVPKQYVATGGSKADGTVVLSYETNNWEIAEPDEAGAQTIASQRCQVWGYRSAEAFGGQTQQCRNQSGVQYCMISKQYQCLD